MSRTAKHESKMDVKKEPKATAGYKKRKLTDLEKIAVAARAEGMTYGQYVAKYNL